jgi:hypothetical protein
MSPWAGSSRVRRAAAAAIVAAGLGAPAAGRVLLTVEEALRLAFPGCAVERRTVFLSETQRARAAERAGVEVASSLVHPYVAYRDGVAVGTAYFDVHPVRSLPETIMVVVGADGRVSRVEVLSFDEPPDYLPRGGWHRQFEGQGLEPELRLGGSIRSIAGATLTARATAAAVRRVLALHQVLEEAAR